MNYVDFLKYRKSLEFIINQPNLRLHNIFLINKCIRLHFCGMIFPRPKYIKIFFAIFAGTTSSQEPNRDINVMPTFFTLNVSQHINLERQSTTSE